MLRTIWGDDERYQETYWCRFPACISPATAPRRDDDGDCWLLGRVDDVMLVSGHNISTTEVESALVSHPNVAEAAVVGATDPTTGQAIVAFPSCGRHRAERRSAHQELRNHVAKTLGPIAKPAPDPDRRGAPEDPLREDHAAPAARRRREPQLGDVTTLQDCTVMDLIAEGLKNAPPEQD